MTRFALLAFMTTITPFAPAVAGDVTIENAKARQSDSGSWRISVTLRHADTGWDHYANEWRVLDEDDRVLGVRVLAHPHVEEQPFTRSLSGITIPKGNKAVWIDARDSVHGRTSKRYKLTLPE